MSAIQLKEVADTAIATPPAGKVALFVDVATGQPSYKDDAGELSSLKGDPGTNGTNGTDGAPGVDGAPGDPGAPGVGVPVGGSVGQVLAKVDGTDFNTQWVDQSGSGGGITSVIAGAGISVDSSDPANPVVSATGGGGGGGGSVGLHSVPIMAGAIQPSASGGSGAVTSTASGSNLPDIVGLSFSATARQNAQFAIPMPKSWNEGTLTARFLWRHPATSTNYGVRWGIQAVAVGDGDAIGSAYGTAQEVSDIGGATNALYRSELTEPFTISGSPAAEDVVYFRVYRDPLHADDNMSVVATLIGVVLYMTTDASTDA